MSFYGTMTLFCCNCGKQFDTTCNGPWRGRACSRSCHRDLEWKNTLSILNKEYYARKLQDDEKAEDKK